MENLFEKKICKNCKKEFYTSKTANTMILCPICKTNHKIDKDKLNLDLKQKAAAHTWVNLDQLLKKHKK